MKKFLTTLLMTGVILMTGNLNAEAKQNIDPKAAEYTEVHAYHILTKTKNQANAIEMRLKNGESFKELAKKFSNCPSGQVGGDLGWFGRKVMVPEFEKAAFETPKGEISDPVQTDFGWHVIKVVDKR